MNFSDAFLYIETCRKRAVIYSIMSISFFSKAVRNTGRQWELALWFTTLVTKQHLKTSLKTNVYCPFHNFITIRTWKPAKKLHRSHFITYRFLNYKNHLSFWHVPWTSLCWFKHVMVLLNVDMCVYKNVETCAEMYYPMKYMYSQLYTISHFLSSKKTALNADQLKSGIYNTLCVCVLFLFCSVLLYRSDSIVLVLCCLFVFLTW